MMTIVTKKDGAENDSDEIIVNECPPNHTPLSSSPLQLMVIVTKNYVGACDGDDMMVNECPQNLILTIASLQPLPKSHTND